jgi:hypothetical protein
VFFKISVLSIDEYNEVLIVGELIKETVAIYDK